MKRKYFHILMAVLALSLGLVSCNLPTVSSQAPVETQSVEEIAQTAIALTVAAQASSIPTVSSVPAPTEVPPTPVPVVQPTACTPMVTATVNANVRSGPSTAYDIVGYLPLGGTAAIAGRNDANTWWYIDFPAGAGGHAWIAGSVTSASCVPDVVAVIAAPPLPPTATATATGILFLPPLFPTHIPILPTATPILILPPPTHIIIPIPGP
ncbi:MAG: hypothetical protein Fur0043_12030 [Anaerolineales bacterium]